MNNDTTIIRYGACPFNGVICKVCRKKIQNNDLKTFLIAVDSHDEEEHPDLFRYTWLQYKSMYGYFELYLMELADKVSKCETAEAIALLNKFGDEGTREELSEHGIDNDKIFSDLYLGYYNQFKNHDGDDQSRKLLGEKQV